tara:strand:- start:4539 stop:5009 length:471 start_codon:yes stop_codon:yes gene_type:complete
MNNILKKIYNISNYEILIVLIMFVYLFSDIFDDDLDNIKFNMFTYLILVSVFLISLFYFNPVVTLIFIFVVLKLTYNNYSNYKNLNLFNDMIKQTSQNINKNMVNININKNNNEKITNTNNKISLEESIINSKNKQFNNNLLSNVEGIVKNSYSSI